MNRYIKRIKVNSIFHLRNFQISIEEDKSPHLIITGKNGSGKTSILNAIYNPQNEMLRENKTKRSAA